MPGHRLGQQRSIELQLSAGEFLDRIAALIPAPRKHRQRYFGVLAPNSHYMWAQLLARIYGVFALQCSRCGGRVHVVGFITEPATVRQILEHVGERTTAPAIAPARSPPLAMNGQQLTAPEGVFEAIPELEFDQTANLAAEAGHDQWTHPAGADAEPVPDLEFDQTLGL